jgi:endonuclease YncB( thermonuclease family)
MKIVRLALFFVYFLIIANPSSAFTGKVVGISDGDTLTLLDEQRQQVKIRLFGIDAPEKKQPYGQNAKQELSALCFGQIATAEIITTDRYRRKVARVECGGKDASVEMVRLGAAWVYRKYSSDRLLLIAEASAQQRRAGLWSLQADQIMPPWEWRKR